MATFNVIINEKQQLQVQQDNNCSMITVLNNSCQTIGSFTVSVPPEESRRVVILPSDEYGSPSIDQVITTTTIFEVTIVEAGSTGGIQNAFNSEILVQIYLEPPSPVMIGFCSLTRIHTGTNCT